LGVQSKNTFKIKPYRPISDKVYPDGGYSGLTAERVPERCTRGPRSGTGQRRRMRRPRLWIDWDVHPIPQSHRRPRGIYSGSL